MDTQTSSRVKCLSLYGEKFDGMNLCQWRSQRAIAAIVDFDFEHQVPLLQVKDTYRHICQQIAKWRGTVHYPSDWVTGSVGNHN